MKISAFFFKKRTYTTYRHARTPYPCSLLFAFQWNPPSSPPDSPPQRTYFFNEHLTILSLGTPCSNYCKNSIIFLLFRYWSSIRTSGNRVETILIVLKDGRATLTLWVHKRSTSSFSEWFIIYNSITL